MRYGCGRGEIPWFGGFVRVALFLLVMTVPALAGEDWALHAQSTFIAQFHPAFASAYRGPNSLDPVASGRETFNITGYAGVRPWTGGEAWADLEMDQGFGLSDTLGAAGFTNGQGSTVGHALPYYRLHRLFFRQSFDLGGEEQDIATGANQLGLTRTADNLIVTLGKFSPADVFDANDYAHDPARDFLNWAVIDAGPWDYAADAWGYSYGGAVEWSMSDWTLRGGLFNLSRLPNGTELARDFSQYQVDGEIERRVTLFGHPGSVKLLGFASRGRIADYNDAVALALATHVTPDVAAVRNRQAWKTGYALNVQQAVGEDWGVFARAALNDGGKEGDEFTDMSSSLLLGASLKGADWGRADDAVGLAFETGGIARAGRRYFALGGLGILIGDGRLDHYGREDIVETYYAAALWDGVAATLDYQFIANPAYNADRGPVSVLGLRLHGEL